MRCLLQTLADLLRSGGLVGGGGIPLVRLANIVQDFRKVIGEYSGKIVLHLPIPIPASAYRGCRPRRYTAGWPVSA
jgi:hypothetical protein